MIDRLNLFWRCAKCGDDQFAPVADLPEAGIPICSECGDDMELRDGAALSSGSGQRILLVGVQAVPHPLIVKVQRGMVMGVQGIPAGIVVEVRDYDSPRDSGSGGRKIESDEDGTYLTEVYDGSAEAEKGESRGVQRRLARQGVRAGKSIRGRR